MSLFFSGLWPNFQDDLFLPKKKVQASDFLYLILQVPILREVEELGHLKVVIISKWVDGCKGSSKSPKISDDGFSTNFNFVFELKRWEVIVIQLTSRD